MFVAAAVAVLAGNEFGPDLWRERQERQALRKLAPASALLAGLAVPAGMTSCIPSETVKATGQLCWSGSPLPLTTTRDLVAALQAAGGTDVTSSCVAGARALVFCEVTAELAGSVFKAHIGPQITRSALPGTDGKRSYTSSGSNLAGGVGDQALPGQPRGTPVPV